MPQKTTPNNITHIVQEALAIEEQSAREAGSLGFVARCMVQATLPHSKVDGNYFQRQNGNFQLTLMGNPTIGLPYGSIPRVLLAWITTEVVRTRESTLLLGDTLSSFMEELDLTPTGGRWGTIPRLRAQMQRLFTCTISCNYADPSKGGAAGINMMIAESYAMWWKPQEPGQAALWQSFVTLGNRFYSEILAHNVPVDRRALRALRRSPLALDIYTWLTYRMSYLSRSTEIPWEALQAQFGADYANLRDFKIKFRGAMSKVLAQYNGAKASEGKRGLVLKPSPTHVKSFPKDTVK
jgi:hypothetical protein